MTTLESVVFIFSLVAASGLLAVSLRRGKRAAAKSRRGVYAYAGGGDNNLEAQTICERASQALSAHVALLVRDHGKLRLIAGAPRTPAFEVLDRTAAQWALTHCIPTGRGSGVMTLSDWQFQPVLSKGLLRGLLSIAGRGAREPVAPDQQWVLEDVLRDVGRALEEFAPGKIDEAPVAMAYGSAGE